MRFAKEPLPGKRDPACACHVVPTKVADYGLQERRPPAGKVWRCAQARGSATGMSPLLGALLLRIVWPTEVAHYLRARRASLAAA